MNRGNQIADGASAKQSQRPRLVQSALRRPHAARAIVCSLALIGAAGCRTEHQVTVDHRISGDINVNVRVDRELDRFFAYEDDLKDEARRPDPTAGTTPQGATP